MVLIVIEAESKFGILNVYQNYCFLRFSNIFPRIFILLCNLTTFMIKFILLQLSCCRRHIKPHIALQSLCNGKTFLCSISDTCGNAIVF